MDQLFQPILLTIFKSKKKARTSEESKESLQYLYVAAHSVTVVNFPSFLEFSSFYTHTGFFTGKWKPHLKINVIKLNLIHSHLVKSSGIKSTVELAAVFNSKSKSTRCEEKSRAWD